MDSPACRLLQPPYISMRRLQLGLLLDTLTKLLSSVFERVSSREKVFPVLVTVFWNGQVLFISNIFV